MIWERNKKNKVLLIEYIITIPRSKERKREKKKLFDLFRNRIFQRFNGSEEKKKTN